MVNDLRCLWGTMMNKIRWIFWSSWHNCQILQINPKILINIRYIFCDFHWLFHGIHGPYHNFGSHFDRQASRVINYITESPNNLGSEKNVWISGGPSYRGRLNIQLAMLIVIIDSLLILKHFSIQYSAKETYLVRNCNNLRHHIWNNNKSK